jgi:nitrogenase-stabilizing/protective protein
MDFPDLRELEHAEEYFEALDVPYERRVLDVYRLHVLKRFGLEREAIDRESELAAGERLRRYREALARAHETYARESAPSERLFRVFEGAPLVPIPFRRDPG